MMWKAGVPEAAVMALVGRDSERRNAYCTAEGTAIQSKQVAQAILPWLPVVSAAKSLRTSRSAT